MALQNDEVVEIDYNPTKIQIGNTSRGLNEHQIGPWLELAKVRPWVKGNDQGFAKFDEDDLVIIHVETQARINVIQTSKIAPKAED